MSGTAVLSDDGKYRYRLTRQVAAPVGLFAEPVPGQSLIERHAQRVLYVMLNPSTADAEVDDPTIRRCKNFAADWGYTHIDVVNLYAYRATDPADLQRARLEGEDIVGPDNLQHVVEMLAMSHLVIVAWGANAETQQPRSPVLDMLQDSPFDLYCLGTTQNGNPRHPLYVRKDVTPVEWKRYRKAL